jgi:septal ring factor EnvC (AmiA/AmiB activator)
VNEIRQLYSENLSQAEEKVKTLTAQLAAIEQENEQLKKAIGEKELQLKQASTSKFDPRQVMVPGPGPSQSQSGRVARITSPRAQVRDLTPEPATSLDETLPDSSARKKGASFCINCGKPRQNPYSQYCIFCGSAFP